LKQAGGGAFPEMGLNSRHFFAPRQSPMSLAQPQSTRTQAKKKLRDRHELIEN
jgi:hypothetical protein